MGRYLTACQGDTRKAMTLYRYNLHLTQDVFIVISCFEVALRNAIDAHLVPLLGEEWLKDSVQPNGIFSGNDFRETRKIIERAYNKLMSNGTYSHSKLLAEMEFGVWKYMFSAKQYRATGIQSLFAWMNIDSRTMLYGLDHVLTTCRKINALKS